MNSLANQAAGEPHNASYQIQFNCNKHQVMNQQKQKARFPREAPDGQMKRTVLEPRLPRGTGPPPHVHPPPDLRTHNLPAPRWRPPPSFRSRYDSMMPSPPSRATRGRWRLPSSFRSRYDSMMPPPPPRAATHQYQAMRQHRGPNKTRSPHAEKNVPNGIAGSEIVIKNEHLHPVGQTIKRKSCFKSANCCNFKSTSCGREVASIVSVTASPHDRPPVPAPLRQQQHGIHPKNNATSKLVNVKQEIVKEHQNGPTKSCLKELLSRKRSGSSLKNDKNHNMSKRLKTELTKDKDAASEPLTDETKKDAATNKPAEAPNGTLTNDISLISGERECDPCSDTHVIFVIDASGSMREADVKSCKGNISRWDAVFKCIDSFLDEQLQQQGLSSNTSCFVSVAIFNTKSRTLLNRMLLDGDGAKVRAALKRQKAKNKPSGGTYFSAGLKQASTLANGSGNDKIVLVFLTDGRPGDLVPEPPAIGSEMQTTFKSHGKINHAAGYYIKMLQKAHVQFNLQLICLYDEGKHWLEYLSKQYHGMLHNPDLSLDDTDLEVVPMKVKSDRTVIREKFAVAQAAGQVISLTGTTTGTRSSIQSTFSSISATVTAMRATTRTERSVLIQASSAMISYDATRMVLTQDAHGDIVFSIAQGETSNSRRVQLSMHPFAQGGLRNVYRMKQASSKTDNMFTAVAKESRHDIHYNERLKFHLETAINQLKAHKYAKKFQRAMEKVDDADENGIAQIKVLRTEVYRLKSASSPGGFRYLAVENELKGPYQKWNNNDGYVNPSQCHQCLVAQAFSHFTYEESNHLEMVVDVQGSGYVYTDPQLHSVEKSYGRADRGETGFNKFMKTHQCNIICRKLKLPDSKSVA